MADENKALVNGLPEHSKIENTDRFLGSGTSEEFLVNLDNLASAVFEKIKSEFGAAAFLKVANNDTTTAEGYVADARAVNALGKEVDAVNSSLTVKTRNIEGSYLTCNITEYGKITWFRISNYLGSTLKQGTEYSPFKFGNIPVHSVIQRIYLTGTSGFLFKISNEDGRVTITPFGADIDSGTGINVSEVYIAK